MSMRLQELHPALVHLPIALLPMAIGTDLVARATGDPGLLATGRRAIGVAAVGAALSAVSGLIAQEEVNVEGKSEDMLITHRNLNLVATIVTGVMAAWRATRDRPTAAYLGVGLAGIATVAYTAYLGGKLVYEHGVGVVPAGGQVRAHAPQLGVSGDAGEFSNDAAVDVARGAKHLGQELVKGKLAPSLGLGKAAARNGPRSAEVSRGAS